MENDSLPDRQAETLPEIPSQLPNGPARATVDAKKDRFKLDYAGTLVLQATVKIVRDGEPMSFKDAAARLFVLSKFDGWDVVTQTIRVAVVGAKPGDLIRLSGVSADSVSDVAVEILTEADDSGVYSPSHDWLLSIDDGSVHALSTEEVPVKGSPETIRSRVVVAAEGAEVMLRFRPYYRQRHHGGTALRS